MKSFFLKMKKAELGFLGIIIIGGSIFYYFFQYRLSRTQISLDDSSPASSTVVYHFFSRLNGQGVLAVEEETPKVVGVMVDNHVNARSHQTGLAAARVVYEALVEGGITRFLALFTANQTIEKVGPVRSARPYFINWLREYGDALYLHSGGSPEALQLIKGIRLFDANEFFWGNFYWRSNDYEPPHNLFTKSSLWQAIIERANRKETSDWQGWKFATSTFSSSTSFLASNEAVRAVTVPYALDYRVSWEYQPGAEVYVRSVNGQESRDEQGNNLAATTVVVQFVPTQVVDEIGRRELATVGSGPLRVFYRGTAVRGSWKKTSPTSRTQFYVAQGEEITLAPGKVWVQVVPTDTTLIITN